jgi:hypothetical protein
MDEAYETEWQWFRRSVRDSLLRPRRFAASLAREHYGLAGVLVAIVAGACFSVSVDASLVASKGLDPASYVSRIATDAVLLGTRLAIVAAIMAATAFLVARSLRHTELTMDQAFTAVTFAFTPLLAMPILALVLVLVPLTLVIVALLAAFLVVRILYGLVENLRSLVPLGVTLAAVAVVVASVPLILTDQVSRLEFVALGYAPQLAPAIVAPPATGDTFVFSGDGYELTLPGRWKSVALGLPDQIGRFETATDVLIVQRIRGNAFLSLDGYADTAALPWRRGLTETGGWLFDSGSTRTVVRTRDLLLVDDVFRGSVDGRPELLRQFTAAAGNTGLALQFRYIEPTDAQRSLDESAAIAASWHALGR